MTRFAQDQAVELHLQRGWVPATILSGPFPGVQWWPEEWYYLKPADAPKTSATVSHIRKPTAKPKLALKPKMVLNPKGVKK